MFLYLAFLLGHTVKKEWENLSLVWLYLRVACVEYNQGVYGIFTSICSGHYHTLEEQILSSGEEESKDMACTRNKNAPLGEALGGGKPTAVYLCFQGFMET